MICEYVYANFSMIIEMKNSVRRKKRKRRDLLIWVLGEQCSIHYEQTLNYGGRKTFPIKPEIDLLISVEYLIAIEIKYIFFFRF